MFKEVNTAKATIGNSLAPPVGGMLAPVSIAQKLGSSSANVGSATGNPRNKCALKPGYSLMGWVRLGNSGEDLAGTGGRVRPVTTEELSKHNKQDDAWMAIRGKVYNVTRYMDYHPGGIDELMRGVGRDATKLFNEVHAWVNYQQLLAKCFVGPLRLSAPKLVESPFELIEESTSTFTSSALNSTTASADMMPRFDWTQKRADITFYIYTRQSCNPGLVVNQINSKTINIRILMEQTAYSLQVDLQNEISWPCKEVKVNAGTGTGKIEITFAKAEAAPWSTFGAHKLTKCLPEGEEVDDLTHDFEVLHIKDFNHDAFELVLDSQSNFLMCLPIGYHVTITGTINGETISRSYTPILTTFLGDTANELLKSNTNLNFLIKSYEEGQLSSHLHQLSIGASLRLSLPRGNFKLSQLEKHRRFAFLAAGSGLTPFLRLLEHLLKRNTNRIEHLQLIYFNKTEADIWCRETLNELQSNDERFQLMNVLSQAPADWNGAHGRISRELLAPLAVKGGPHYATFVAVCGPYNFNQLAKELLEELSFTTENVHVFQG